MFRSETGQLLVGRLLITILCVTVFGGYLGVFVYNTAQEEKHKYPAEPKAAALFGPGSPWAVLADADKAKVVLEIVSDPRYPGPEKFFALLQSFGQVKSQLIERGLVDKVNTLYGWHLSLDGSWTVPQTNDVIYGIIAQPRFETTAAVAAIASGLKPSEGVRGTTQSSPDNSRNEDIGQIDPDLALRIQRYKSLANSGQGEAALEAIEGLRPDMERFVEAHPNNATGHLELSGLFITPVFIAVDSLPAGPKRATAALRAVQPDKLRKARRELNEFKRLAAPNDPKIASADELLASLDKIETKK